MFGGPAPPPERWLPAPRHGGKRSDHLLKNSIFLFSSFPLLFSSRLFSLLFSSLPLLIPFHVISSFLLSCSSSSIQLSSLRLVASPRLVRSRLISSHYFSLYSSLRSSPLVTCCLFLFFLTCNLSFSILYVRLSLFSLMIPPMFSPPYSVTYCSLNALRSPDPPRPTCPIPLLLPSSTRLFSPLSPLSLLSLSFLLLSLLSPSYLSLPFLLPARSHVIPSSEMSPLASKPACLVLPRFFSPRLVSNFFVSPLFSHSLCQHLPH